MTYYYGCCETPWWILPVLVGMLIFVIWLWLRGDYG